MSAEARTESSLPTGDAATARAALPGLWLTRLALVAILGLAALLRLWHLDQNGYGRSYYAAGVRSMMNSWHCFFYNSFDAAGFVSLDKPPLALWMQVLSAKVLGFSAFSVMLPQVLEGLVAIALLYRIVVPRFGRTAALVAALVLALTPISVAIDRSNNTDSCLILVLVLAAWAAIRAAETASGRLLVLSMALLGVAFNVKMAAALVPAPAFLLAYWLATGRLPARQRLTSVAVSMAVLLVLSLSWATAFDLTPPGQRPYAGSTHHNSMLELTVLHNGLDRFVQRGKVTPPTPDEVPATSASDSGAAPVPSAPALWDQTPVGPLRLATPRLAAQVDCLLPLCIAAVAFGFWSWRRERRLAATHWSLVVWSGWAFSYAVVFSFAGGVFHTYYLAVLAPALAALAGIGWAAVWTRAREGVRHWVAPAALLATAAWQAYIAQGFADWRTGDWRTWLLLVPLGAMVIAAGALLARRTGTGRWTTPIAVVTLFAALANPAAWALSTVLVRPNVAAPAANIAAFAAIAIPADRVQPTTPAARAAARKFIGFLRSQRGSERFLVAMPNALQAAPIIVRTGEPVMAMGGYLGSDPILSPGDLERMANSGELRFVLLGGFSLVSFSTPGEQALADWVRSHGRPVDPALWRYPDAESGARAGQTTRSGAPPQLYDLRPARS